MDRGQRLVISATVWGNTLPWFEIYLFPFWVPILSQVFFNSQTPLFNLIGAFVIFGSGFLARPVGALFFGHMGDKIGRKQTFIRTIFLVTFPTFFIGCLQPYSDWGIWSPILLAVLRLAQAIPIAGEVPGTVCYLYEYANRNNRLFMTSWAGFGNQIGAILAIIESFLMKNLASNEFLLHWGWRISFWIGGLLGILGIYLRKKLHETKPFEELKDHNLLEKLSAFKVVKNNIGKIIQGTAYGVLNASTFYLIATYIPTYFINVLNLNNNVSMIISILILILTTVLLPYFGMVGDKMLNKNKKLLIYCAYSVIVLLIPLYYSISCSNLKLMFVVGFLYIIPVTCLTALLAYRIAHLFPTAIRFTGFGVSFNIADGIFGGFTPAISILLTHYTGNEAGFCWYILFCAIISLWSYYKIKD